MRVTPNFRVKNDQHADTISLVKTIHTSYVAYTAVNDAQLPASVGTLAEPVLSKRIRIYLDLSVVPIVEAGGSMIIDVYHGAFHFKDQVIITNNNIVSLTAGIPASICVTLGPVGILSSGTPDNNDAQFPTGHFRIVVKNTDANNDITSAEPRYIDLLLIESR